MFFLLSSKPINDIDPATIEVIIAKVVVQGKLHDRPAVEQIDCLLGRRDVNPALGRSAVNEVVIEPYANLAVAGGLFRGHQDGSGYPVAAFAF